MGLLCSGCFKQHVPSTHLWKETKSPLSSGQHLPGLPWAGKGQLFIYCLWSTLPQAVLFLTHRKWEHSKIENSFDFHKEGKQRMTSKLFLLPWANSETYPVWCGLCLWRGSQKGTGWWWEVAWALCWPETHPAGNRRPQWGSAGHFASLCGPARTPAHAPMVPCTERNWRGGMKLSRVQSDQQTLCWEKGGENWAHTSSPPRFRRSFFIQTNF